jgi:hypothetical protein
MNSAFRPIGVTDKRREKNRKKRGGGGGNGMEGRQKQRKNKWECSAINGTVAGRQNQFIKKTGKNSESVSDVKCQTYSLLSAFPLIFCASFTKKGTQKMVKSGIKGNISNWTRKKNFTRYESKYTSTRRSFWKRKKGDGVEATRFNIY